MKLTTLQLPALGNAAFYKVDFTKGHEDYTNNNETIRQMNFNEPEKQDPSDCPVAVPPPTKHQS